MGLNVWNTVIHPLRPRTAFEVMIKELLHPHGVVLPVRPLVQIVALAIVVEQINFFAQPAKSQIKLKPSGEWSVRVGIVVEDHERRLYPIGSEDGRVFDKELGVLPEIAANPALIFLICPLIGLSVREGVVSASHVHCDRAGFGGAETVGVRDNVRHLKATPTVTLNAYGFLIDESLSDDRIDS